MENHNRGVDPEDIATQCVAAGVAVFTVTFEDGADEDRMEDIAESANGFHIHASDSTELEEAFETIARQLSIGLIE